MKQRAEDFVNSKVSELNGLAPLKSEVIKWLIDFASDEVKAINYNRSSLQLKTVDKLGYTAWKDKIGLIKDVDKGLYKLKGNYITTNEVLDMFEVYCDSF